jgi:ATP-dependent DNA ligase
VAVDRLKVRSCLIDGEAVACDENGLADLRREPIETRKATLASLLRGSLPGLRLNEHLAHDGESRHACKMGLVRMRQFAKVAAHHNNRAVPSGRAA